MTRQVAFLRGINLGNRRVKMDRLRAHFEELGLEGVATYLASGNVVFDRPGSDSATLEVEIEEHLAGALGYEVKTFVRDLPRLDRLTGRAMFAAAREDGFTPYLIFRRTEPDRHVTEAVQALETPDDRFHLLDREVIWLRRGRLTDSVIATRDLESALGGSDHTRRKLTTVERIVARFAGRDEG